MAVYDITAAGAIKFFIGHTNFVDSLTYLRFFRLYMLSNLVIGGLLSLDPVGLSDFAQ